MSRRRAEALLNYLLVVSLGISGALLLSWWGACEQYEGYCPSMWSAK